MLLFALKIKLFLRPPVIYDQNYWNQRVVVKHGLHYIQYTVYYFHVELIMKISGTGQIACRSRDIPSSTFQNQSQLPQLFPLQLPKLSLQIPQVTDVPPNPVISNLFWQV